MFWLLIINGAKRRRETIDISLSSLIWIYHYLLEQIKVCQTETTHSVKYDFNVQHIISVIFEKCYHEQCCCYVVEIPKFLSCFDCSRLSCLKRAKLGYDYCYGNF